MQSEAGKEKYKGGGKKNGRQVQNSSSKNKHLYISGMAPSSCFIILICERCSENYTVWKMAGKFKWYKLILLAVKH